LNALGAELRLGPVKAGNAEKKPAKVRKFSRFPCVLITEVIKDDQFYRPKDVAAALRVSTVTISRAIRQGKLKAFRIGGQWRILGSEIPRDLEAETTRSLGIYGADQSS
jgi:excisionase family DNA binding protein